MTKATTPIRRRRSKRLRHAKKYIDVHDDGKRRRLGKYTAMYEGARRLATEEDYRIVGIIAAWSAQYETSGDEFKVEDVREALEQM